MILDTRLPFMFTLVLCCFGCYENGGHYHSEYTLGDFCDDLTLQPHCLDNYLVTCRNHAIDYLDCSVIGEDYTCQDFSEIHYAADCSKPCTTPYRINLTDDCANNRLHVDVCLKANDGSFGFVREGSFATYCEGNAYYTCQNGATVKMNCNACTHHANDTVSCQ